MLRCGSFGHGALVRGRRLYTTSLSGDARRRHAARREAAESPLARAREEEARYLFGGPGTDEMLRQLMTVGSFRSATRRRVPTRFEIQIRRELLGENSAS
jgi:hypothetical protein